MTNQGQAVPDPFQQPPPPPPRGLSFAPQRVEATGNPNSIAVIARPKAGKTTLAASASEIPRLKAAGKKVLILEAEKGTASVARNYPNAEFQPVRDFPTYDGYIRELLTVQHDYGVVVTDTFDRVQGMAERFFLANAGGDSRAAYGKLKIWAADILWAMHDANWLSISLFHEDYQQNGASNVLETTFKLVGSAGKDIGQIFDMIAHLRIEDDQDGNPQRVLQLGPKGGLPTGNRWEDVLPNRMINGTLPQIYELLDAAHAPASEKTPAVPNQNKEQ